jgi:hypothetical protein
MVCAISLVQEKDGNLDLPHNCKPVKTPIAAYCPFCAMLYRMDTELDRGRTNQHLDATAETRCKSCSRPLTLDDIAFGFSLLCEKCRKVAIAEIWGR